MSSATLSDTVSRARNWRVASASARGTSHIKTGKPCQDSVYHSVTSGGALIAAVSDGAGSAARSEIGSALAVKKAVEYARLSMLHTSARPSEAFLRDTVQSLRSARALCAAIRKRDASARASGTSQPPSSLSSARATRWQPRR